MPTNIPAIAPSRLVRWSKMPSRMIGKKLAAARPKAKATTSATNPGGWMPK